MKDYKIKTGQREVRKGSSGWGEGGKGAGCGGGGWEGGVSISSSSSIHQGSRRDAVGLSGVRKQ